MASLRRRLRRLRHRKGAALVAVVVVLYAAALYLFIQGTAGDSGGPSAAGRTTSSAPGGLPPEQTSVPSLSSGGGTGSTVDVSNPSTTETHTLPGGTITVQETAPPSSAPPTVHQIVLRVTSSASRVARLGFLVPTSPDRSYGDMRDHAAPWVLRTTATGSPQYAEIFLQTDGSGAAVTCSIEVDGKVTDRATTQGAYGQATCLG